jgi:hypothetical protein
VIVWVDDRLFEAGAREVDRLALLRGAALRRHTLVVSTDPSAASRDRRSPGFDAWRAALPDRIRREVDLLCERLGRVTPNAVARGAGRLLVSDRRPDAAGCWVTMEEAVRAVVLPTYVLVENAINDRAFLRRAMPPVWRDRLDAWEHAGLLRYENGGGNAVMRAIVVRHGDDGYAREAFGLPSRLWAQVHVVVYDHDGDDAGHPSTESSKLGGACRDAGLAERSHRLHRRDQEHYLPREVLEAIVQSRAKPDEREGLLEKVAEHLADGERRHFRELPRLGQGPFFKNEFDEPLDWRDEWFQRDGAWAEMTLLAETIAAAI